MRASEREGRSGADIRVDIKRDVQMFPEDM